MIKQNKPPIASLDEGKDKHGHMCRKVAHHLGQNTNRVSLLLGGRSMAWTYERQDFEMVGWLIFSYWGLKATEIQFVKVLAAGLGLLTHWLYSIQKFRLKQSVFKIQDIFLTTSELVLGLFVLNWMHFCAEFKYVRKRKKVEKILICLLDSTALQIVLKGLSVMDHSKLHFFTNPQFFVCIFRENFTVLNYLYNDSHGNGIFLGRETILCCWEFIIANNILIKPVFPIVNHLNLEFLKF